MSNTMTALADVPLRGLENSFNSSPRHTITLMQILKEIRTDYAALLISKGGDIDG